MIVAGIKMKAKNRQRVSCHCAESRSWREANDEKGRAKMKTSQFLEKMVSGLS